MKKLDLNKTLRTILLVLAIVLMLIKLINKASAEGLPDYLEDIENTYFDSISGTNKAAVESVINDWDLKYFFIGKQSGTPGSWDHGGQAILLFTDVDNIYLPFYLRITNSYGTSYIQQRSYNSTSGLYFSFNNASYCNVWNDYTSEPYSGTVHGLAIWQDWHGSPWCVKFTYEFNNGVASSYSYSSVGSLNSGNQSYSNAFSISNYLSYGDFYAFSPVISGGSAAFCESYIEKVSYTDTGFFNIWTSVNQASQKVLNISWPESVYPSSGSMNYVKSIMDLTIEVNGTAQTISFDSIENPELFPTSSGTYIPYKFLQKVADLAEVSPSDSFYLTMVSLTQYAYPAGAPSSSATAYNETSLCSVDLGEIQIDVPSITPVADIPISETNISNTSYFQDVVGGVISSDTSYPIPSWANVCRVGLSDSAFPLWDSNFIYNDIAYNRWVVSFDLRLWYSYQSSDDPSLNASNIVSFTGDIRPLYQWIGNDVGQFFDMYYFDNVREFCDVFILDLYINNTSTSPATWDLSQRLIFYTDRYFQRLQIESVGNIQSMIEANTYYTKALYDYSTVRFDGMAQSLEKLRISNNALLGSINANIINLQGLVSSGTDRIVNAIQGISGGGLSVSDLSGTLNTLFMPSFEWDTVNYQDYLDSLGVLALPFEFVFDTQSIIKNNYSSTIVLPINDFSVPLGKDFNDNDIEFTVFEDHESFEYDPTDIFPSALWSVFQYLAAFGLVIGEAWFTYVHIFRKEEKSGDF